MGDIVKAVHEYLYTNSSHQNLRGGSSWSDFGLYKKIWGTAPSWLLELHNSSRRDARFACMSHRGAKRRGAGCRVQNAEGSLLGCAVCSLQQHSFVQFKTRNEGNKRRRDDSISRTCQSSFQSNRSRCPLPPPLRLVSSFVSLSLRRPIKTRVRVE